MEKLKFSAHQKIIVALLAITQFTVVLDFMVMSPMGDILMKSLNIVPKQFGLAVSSYAFSAGLSGILTAGFADRFDRKRLLIFFYTGFILGTFLCSIAPNFHFLMMARIVTGLFGGVIGSISMTIVTDLFPLQMRGRTMSTIQMGFAASQVLGIPIGLYIANLWGWHAPFTMIVGLGVLIVLLISRFMEPVDQHLSEENANNVWEHFRDVLSKGNYQIAFLTTALISIGAFLLQPFSATFLVNNLKVSHAQLPMVFMVTGISSFIIMPIIGRMSDKLDKFKIFAIGSIWAIVMIDVFCNLTPMPLWMIIGVNILLFIGIMSRMVPATAYISAVPEMADRGAFMSINSSLQQVAGGIAAAFAGMVIVQKDKFSPLEKFSELGYITIAICVVCIYLVYRISLIVKSKNDAYSL